MTISGATSKTANEQRMKLRADMQLLTLSSAKQPRGVSLTVRCVTALKCLWKCLFRNFDGWERRTPGSTTARPRTTRGTRSVTRRWWKSVSVQTPESVFQGPNPATSRRETQSWGSVKQSVRGKDWLVCQTQIPGSVTSSWKLQTIYWF